MSLNTAKGDECRSHCCGFCQNGGFHQEIKKKPFSSIDGFLEADVPLFLYTAGFVRRMETVFCFHISSLASILTDVL